MQRIVLGLSLTAALILAGCHSEAPGGYQINAHYTIHDPQFPRAIGSLLGPGLIGGNRCDTLANGDQIFPAMLAAIRSAKKSICMETYILWSGNVGEAFTSALCERAGAGVKVHLIIDWEGSSQINPAFIQKLRECHVEIIEYHPFDLSALLSPGKLDHRTHRKLLVVDGKVGFIGGVGIADIWSGKGDRPDHWRDNHYRVEGPVVGQLQAAFEDNWIKTTGHVLVGDDYFPPLANAGPLQAQVFKSSPQGGSEDMRLLMLLSLAAAGKDVLMESAYFVPDRVTRGQLIFAAKRGVKVEIIVPGREIDQQLVRAASRASWGELLKAGIRIYEFNDTMIHCKLAVIDGRWTSVGSANLDNRSFKINDEANLNILDDNFAFEQRKLFEQDKKRSREITYAQWENRPALEKLGEFFASLLDPEL